MASRPKTRDALTDVQKMLKIQELTHIVRYNLQKKQREEAAAVGLSKTNESLTASVPTVHIPIIDEYYRNVDTTSLIERMRFTSELERLKSKIKTIWHAFRTPQSEVDRVTRKIEEIHSRYLASDHETQQ